MERLFSVPVPLDGVTEMVWGREEELGRESSKPLGFNNQPGRDASLALGASAFHPAAGESLRVTCGCPTLLWNKRHGDRCLPWEDSH